MSRRVPLQPCGTYAAYRRHEARGEKPCAACVAAENRYHRELRASGPRPVKLQPCGTEAAYQRHRRRGAPVDEACREAHNALNRAWRAARIVEASE